MDFLTFKQKNSIKTVQLNSLDDISIGDLVYVLGDTDGGHIDEIGIVKSIEDPYATVDVYYLSKGYKEVLNLAYYEMELFLVKEQ